MDYYIAQEVTKPVDGAFGASVYMYKARDADPAEGDQGKLFMGPMWDYDIGMGDFQTLGGKGLTDTWMLRDPLGPGTGQGDVNWYNRLMQDPAFVAAVTARWAVVKPTLLGTVNGYLPAQRDLGWPKSRQPRTSASGTSTTRPGTGRSSRASWNAEVTYLQQWLQQRIAWMDGQLAP